MSRVTRRRHRGPIAETARPRWRPYPGQPGASKLANVPPRAVTASLRSPPHWRPKRVVRLVRCGAPGGWHSRCIRAATWTARPPYLKLAIVRPDCAISGPEESDLRDAVELLERQLTVEHPTLRDLANAVQSARVIGEALAIIRASEHCSLEQAFLMLAHESRNDHLAIRDITEWVVLTGRY